ncbi:copper resistance protein CopC [Lysinibacillus sp. KU-BSD001]|uniref:copper resistance CopC family protein n=1 Tax=Lysinibacillus sp. KU-BSD001 TaxID=3141328 RepID=UPI0036ECC448
MKKTSLAALFLAIFVNVPGVDAHTHLHSTNPENGSEVTTELSSISLTYEGQIEEGSSFDITSSEGQNIEVETFSIEDSVLTGTLAQPLENDQYTVAWTTISEDGHPLTGEFSFTVNVPQTTAEEDITLIEETQTEEATKEVSEQTAAANESTEKAQSSNTLFIALGLLAAIIIASAILLLKRKK